LLDVRIVVFLVRAAAGELDLVAATVLEERQINEFRAVVALVAAVGPPSLRD
jgi:hypothetical protein